MAHLLISEMIRKSGSAKAPERRTSGVLLPDHYTQFIIITLSSNLVFIRNLRKGLTSQTTLVPTTPATTEVTAGGGGLIYWKTFWKFLSFMQQQVSS